LASVVVTARAVRGRGPLEERHRNRSHRLGEQLVGAGPVAVHGRPADAGVVGDLAVGDRARTAGEQQFARRGDDRLAAALETGIGCHGLIL
jgi:hypothetical protein